MDCAGPVSAQPASLGFRGLFWKGDRYEGIRSKHYHRSVGGRWSPFTDHLASSVRFELQRRTGSSLKAWICTRRAWGFSTINSARPSPVTSPRATGPQPTPETKRRG